MVPRSVQPPATLRKAVWRSVAPRKLNTFLKLLPAAPSTGPFEAAIFSGSGKPLPVDTGFSYATAPSPLRLVPPGLATLRSGHGLLRVLLVQLRHVSVAGVHHHLPQESQLLP